MFAFVLFMTVLNIRGFATTIEPLHGEEAVIAAGASRVHAIGFSAPHHTTIGGTARVDIQAQCYSWCQQRFMIADEKIHKAKCEELILCSECVQGLEHKTAKNCSLVCVTQACQDGCQCIQSNGSHLENRMDQVNKIDEVNDQQNTEESTVELLCQEMVNKTSVSVFVRLVPTDMHQQHQSPAIVEAEVRTYNESIWKSVTNSSTSIVGITNLRSATRYHVRLSSYDEEGRLQMRSISRWITTMDVDKTVKPLPPSAVNFENIFLGPNNTIQMNVTWKSSSDRTCCFGVLLQSSNYKENRNERMCNVTKRWMVFPRVTLGNKYLVWVYAHKSRNHGFSYNYTKLEYKVPECIKDESGVMKHPALCRPPTPIKLCSREIPIQGSNLMNITITWVLPAHVKGSPRYTAVVIRYLNKNGVTDNQQLLITQKPQTTDVEMSTVLSNLEMAESYEIFVSVETEAGERGLEATLKRRMGLINSVQFYSDNKSLRVSEFTCPSTIIMDYEKLATPEFMSTTPIGMDAMGTGFMPSRGLLLTPMVAAIASVVTLLLTAAGLFVLVALRLDRRRRRMRQGWIDSVEQADKSKGIISSSSRRHSTKSYSKEDEEPLKGSEVTQSSLNYQSYYLTLKNLKMGPILGEGAFGVVRSAQMKRSVNGLWDEVAVKMLKDNCCEDDRRELNKEVALMKAVGRHPHILCMVGCSSPTDPAGPFLVIEHCALGDLQNFLRKEWKRLTTRNKNLESCEIFIGEPKVKYAELLPNTDIYDEENAPSEGAHLIVNPVYGCHEDKLEIPEEEEKLLTSADLLSIARQVAMGMEYLSNNRVVHRDLAARNVLVMADHSIKIADFGLSRDVYEQNVYHKTGEGRLPIKWMALESLLHQVYTTASDVWSYGVLLWEIVTLGGTPYPGVTTGQVFSLLRSGYRMEKPENCSNQLYDIMLRCWLARPVDRPSFMQLREEVEVLLETCSTAVPYLPLMDYGSPTLHNSSSSRALQSSRKAIELPNSAPAVEDTNYLQPVTAISSSTVKTNTDDDCDV